MGYDDRMATSTANDCCVLLVGGPDAGKTNYLVRLWIALRSGTGCLRADGLPEDVEYLNEGAQALLSGEFVPRTSREVHAHNLIPIRTSPGPSDFRGRLVIPDCSGEEWLLIHRTREWSDRWEQAIPSLLGCLLFVRAGSDEIHAPLDWVNCMSYFGTLENLPDTIESADGGFQMPTQAVLIDWLQCLRSAVTAYGAGSRRLRVGVMVAAWDRVPKDQRDDPRAYVAANFPMFDHFVLSNTDRFAVECFGVSVVGDDLEHAPGFRAEFLRGSPTHAGYVIHSLGKSPVIAGDHTIPLAWAMGLDTLAPPDRAGSVP